MKQLTYFVVMVSLVMTMGCQGQKQQSPKSADTVVVKVDSVDSSVVDTVVIEDDEFRQSYFLEEKYMPLFESLHKVQLKYNDWEGFNEQREATYNKKIKQTLASFYDTLHKGNKLSFNEKATRMLKELEGAYHPDKAFNNLDMVMSNDLNSLLTRYKLNNLTKELLTAKPQFKKEYDAWNKLFEALDSYVGGVSQLYWFGGSGSSLASISATRSLKEVRLKDLKAILAGKQLLSKHKDMTAEQANKLFMNATDKAMPDFSTDKEVIEAYGKVRLEQYRDLEKKVKNSYGQLSLRFDEWIKQRERLNINNTSVLVKDLVQVVLDTDPHGKGFE